VSEQNPCGLLQKLFHVKFNTSKQRSREAKPMYAMQNKRSLEMKEADEEKSNNPACASNIEEGF